MSLYIEKKIRDLLTSVISGGKVNVNNTAEIDVDSDDIAAGVSAALSDGTDTAPSTGSEADITTIAWLRGIWSKISSIQSSFTEVKEDTANLETIAVNTADLKWNKVAAVVADTAITQTNLVGFAITTAGTCVFVDADGGEMDMSKFTEGIYPGLPAKFKTGLVATVKALYLV